jgi:hypothetical protein
MPRRNASCRPVSFLLPVLVLTGFAACGPGAEPPAGTGTGTGTVDAAAERYVRIALAFAAHDPAYVDSYFGPAEWKAAAEAEPVDLNVLMAETDEHLAALGAVDPAGLSEEDALRLGSLRKRFASMRLRMDMVGGRRLPFDEESRVLFDAVAPDRDAAYFQDVLDQIDEAMPGDGPLPQRVEAFRQGFVIPPDRLDAVFQAAIAECRRRTLAHIALPPGESFRVEYVTDKPWSGYNWYQGDFYSVIQVNTDLPIFISRAVDLGCHEGYPGHHTYNALVEQQLVDGRGWVEFTVNPLYGPQSPISEGSANYGIQVAFPDDERAVFERDVLFPLAGLDPARAERYYHLLDLLERLSYAGNEAARDYLNGGITREETIDWLVQYSLSSPERAAQRTRFFDTYRSYVINYNLGRDLVRAYVERRAGDDRDARWREFQRLLSLPLTPSDLS